jgi:DNA-binding transcriptional LysR family regulator
METTLGVRLFDRTAHGVEPNLYGRALLKWGGAIFDDLRQGINELDYLADPTSGELRVAAAEPIVAGFLPAVIEKLTRRHPRIVFRITSLHSPSLYDALYERKVDIIIARMRDNSTADDVDVECLFDEPQFVTAGINNRLCRKRTIELVELIDEPWTLPQPDNFAGKLVAETFQLCGLEHPRASVVCNSIQMHNALLATGYLAMYPRSLLRFSAQRLSVKRLPVKLPKRPAPVGLMRLKNRTVSPVAQLFIECAREVAKPLANEDQRDS